MDSIAFSIMQRLLEWDRALFKIVNSDCANPFFDAVMPFLRKSTHWIPLYLFLFIFVVLNFRRKAIWWIVFFLATIAMADSTGTYLFKYGFERTRPCNNPEMLENLRLLVLCPSGYGFTSNHAANHFGMATFLFISFRHLFKNWMLIAFGWAGLICFAQVYVGVHYPSDVFAGGLLGLLYGSFTGWQFNKHFGLGVPGKN